MSNIQTFVQNRGDRREKTMKNEKSIMKKITMTFILVFGILFSVFVTTIQTKAATLPNKYYKDIKGWWTESTEAGHPLDKHTNFKFKITKSSVIIYRPTSAKGTSKKAKLKQIKKVGTAKIAGYKKTKDEYGTHVIVWVKPSRKVRSICLPFSSKVTSLIFEYKNGHWDYDDIFNIKVKSIKSLDEDKYIEALFWGVFEKGKLLKFNGKYY